jgi:hypothetical protein
MQPYINHETLNLVVKEKIAGWQQHAEVANRARLLWAIRFVTRNKIRPDYTAKPGTYNQHPVQG